MHRTNSETSQVFVPLRHKGRDRHFLSAQPGIKLGAAPQYPDGSVHSYGLAPHLIYSVALKIIKDMSRRFVGVLLQSGNRWFPSQRLMPTDMVAVVHVRRQIMPQMIQEPLIVLPIEVPHVVLEGPLQFAVGLRV